MAINSTSYKKFPVKILEDQQKSLWHLLDMVSLVIVSYENISIKTEWREYQIDVSNKIIDFRKNFLRLILFVYSAYVRITGGSFRQKKFLLVRCENTVTLDR